MPKEGLRQSMLRSNIKLDYMKDIFFAPGVLEDDVSADISRFFIADAIQRLYPKAIATIYGQSFRDEFKMPQIDRLKVEGPLESYILGAIPFNEGTLTGNYKVHESIFLDQLGRNRETDFIDTLYLTYGDQKTTSLNRSIKNEQRTAQLPFDRRDWCLPIPALFHLRMNFLWMVQRTHSGGVNANEPPSLYHNMNFWDRKDVPLSNAPFHQLEELILHSWDSRVLGILYTWLAEDGVAIQRHEAVEEHLSRLSPVGFCDLVNSIRLCAFTSKSWSPSIIGNVIENHVDKEFLAHVRFLQEVEVYKTLKYAIKWGDIGLIERVINISCIYFNATKQNNYANEMLYMKWLLQTNACDSILKRAILSNSLVNTHGKEDTWQEIDINIEHHNLVLKELLYARQNSTFNLNHLFKMVALTSAPVRGLQEKIERSIGETNSGYHTTKSASLDIHVLAHFLAGNSIKLVRRGRSCNLEAPDLFSDSAVPLEKAVKALNDRVFYDPEILLPIIDDEGPTDDLPGDVPLGEIEVHYCIII